MPDACDDRESSTRAPFTRAHCATRSADISCEDNIPAPPLPALPCRPEPLRPVCANLCWGAPLPGCDRPPRPDDGPTLCVGPLRLADIMLEGNPEDLPGPWSLSVESLPDRPVPRPFDLYGERELGEGSRRGCTRGRPSGTISGMPTESSLLASSNERASLLMAGSSVHFGPACQESTGDVTGSGGGSYLKSIGTIS